jgi:hypothetical protein
MLSVAWVAVAASPILAQDTEPRPPAAPVAPTHRAESTVVAPATPNLPSTTIPGLEDADFLISQAPLRSEGTFLVEQRGSMLRLPTGEWIFVFHKDDKGKRERPMVLAPSQTLQRMEQVVGERGPDTTMVVSGQVLVYINVNYLVPSVFRVVQGEPASSANLPKPPTGPLKIGASDAKDPLVADLIRELEAQRDLSRTARSGSAPSPAASAPKPSATGPDAPKLTPEGEAVIRRRARMIRGGDGKWALAFDSGPGGDGALDRPLVAIPCMNLQRMEAWAGRGGDQLSFEVSGRILTYGGRNYILPTMFQVYPPNDLQPQQ